jgi:membrane-associated phospholipid phosphatase
MAMAQLYSDSLQALPLEDLGFKLLPEARHLVWPTTCFYATIADVWIAVTYVVFVLVLVPFLTDTPWTCKTRFTWCLTAVYMLRAITLLCTRYPRFPGVNAPYVLPAADMPWGAILVILGVRTTQTDYMFSGHTAGWALTAMFFWHYKRSKNNVVAIVFWAFNVTGMFLLIAVREHYTADVVVALIVSVLVFNVYHLALAAATAPLSTIARFIAWLEK